MNFHAPYKLQKYSVHTELTQSSVELLLSPGVLKVYSASLWEGGLHPSCSLIKDSFLLRGKSIRKQDVDSFDMMPTKLRTELAIHVNLKTLKKVNHLNCPA